MSLPVSILASYRLSLFSQNILMVSITLRMKPHALSWPPRANICWPPANSLTSSFVLPTTPRSLCSKHTDHLLFFEHAVYACHRASTLCLEHYRRPRGSLTLHSCLCSILTFTLRLSFPHLLKKQPLNPLTLLYFTSQNLSILQQYPLVLRRYIPRPPLDARNRG